MGKNHTKRISAPRTWDTDRKATKFVTKQSPGQHPKMLSYPINVLLKEIIGNLHSATINCLELVKAVLASDFKLVNDDCPCRRSLELAVWTKEEQISDSNKEKLKVLFD